MALTVEQAIKDGWSKTEAPKFVAFMRDVDNYVLKQTGLGVHDLEDWEWADAYESGQSAYDAACEFIEEVMGEEFL